MVYRVSSRTAGATQRKKPYLKKKKERNTTHNKKEKNKAFNIENLEPDILVNW